MTFKPLKNAALVQSPLVFVGASPTNFDSTILFRLPVTTFVDSAELTARYEVSYLNYEVNNLFGQDRK